MEKKSALHASAEVHLSENGNFVYCSNRLENTIGVFSVDKISGRLRTITHVDCGGINPRSFCLVPGGKFLVVANQESHEIVVFKIHPGTGIPEKTQQVLSVRLPSAIVAHDYGKN
jgi:6-phosphogluconolactonase